MERRPKKINSNQCYDSCSETSNKYDYLSKSQNSCLGNIYTIEYLLKCVDAFPSSTYTIGRKCEKCHPDCKECKGPFNETNANCASCLSPDKYLEDGNCINKTVYTTILINEITTIDIAKEMTTMLIPEITTNIPKEMTTVITPDFTTNNIQDITTEYTPDITTTDLMRDETSILISEATTTELMRDKASILIPETTTTDITRDETTNILKNLTTCENIIKSLSKDKYINIASLCNIKNNTMIYNIIVENLLPIFDPENDPEIIIEAVDNIIFQITTSKNQLMELTDDSLNENNLSILDIVIAKKN